MERNCVNCGKKLYGRSDKKYCSLPCKNAYSASQRRETRSITREVDQILHRNHIILRTLMGPERNKMMISHIELTKMGFNFNFITGYYKNKEGKTYHNVYDFAWMAFSTQEILIVCNKRGLKTK